MYQCSGASPAENDYIAAMIWVPQRISDPATFRHGWVGIYIRFLQQND